MKALILFLFFCWQSIALAAVTTQVDPSSIQIGDSFRLTFTIEGSQDAGIPDLTPLQKLFNIVGTERSMSYSIVNNQAHSASQWTVVLSPKITGTLPIPAIKFGQQQSEATKIEVTGDKPTTTADDQGDKSQAGVMLKVELSETAPYVNQQVIYTVKLYNSQQLLNAEYQPPQVEDALLITLGDARRYHATIDGRIYAVEELNYAITPQKSGFIKINPPGFKALVYDSVPKHIRLRAKTTHLNVKPIPENFKGKDWLPSKKVVLTEIYDHQDTSMNEGSTLVRTVTLQASGIPAQLLPVLEFASGSQFSSYPEKAEQRNTVVQQELIGRETVKVTYLFNRAGRITIPALQLPWFNSETGKEEIASLPERTIDIIGNTVKQQATNEAKATSLPKPISPTMEKPSYTIAWWLVGGFALAWMLTLALWWLSRHRFKKHSEQRQALKLLAKACKTNNPLQVQTALLKWASVRWPDEDVLTIYHLEKLISDESLKTQLAGLSQVLFSQEKNSSWKADELWACIKSYLDIKPTTKEKNRDELPPINPF